DDLHSMSVRLAAVFRYWHGASGRRNQDQPQLVAALLQVLGRSVELRNPLRLQLREDEREMVRLTQDQFRVLDLLSRARRALIGGCAGSGKTFLAVEKAHRLAAEG